MDSTDRSADLEESDDAVMQAAWFYYHDKLTQSEIASRLSVSRPTVGRLLQRARSENLVTITLHPKIHSTYGLGSALRDAFGLKDAVIFPSPGDGDGAALAHRLATSGAKYLSSVLEPGYVVALSWSNTVTRTVLSLERNHLDSVKFVTLTGGVDPYLRALVGANKREQPIVDNMVPAPLLASSPELAKALMDERAVQLALHEAREADVALIGIGSTDPGATVVQLGYQTAEELEHLRQKGIVGDILGRFYNKDGYVADLDIHRRVIGTDLSELREMKQVVGIAGGLNKVAAITGALAGGYLDVLITDQDTAVAILEARKSA